MLVQVVIVSSPISDMCQLMHDPLFSFSCFTFSPCSLRNLAICRSSRRITLSDWDDPLTYALEPPPNETVEEKNAREAKEAEAKRVSDLIDESIKNDRAAMKKEKEVVKVLLLGQSESGKYDWVSPYLIETS